ncbi:MAG: hypothetical protein AB7V56_04260 [Candidatus Nitrosocosmicus sp.]|jgi:hypothetical protein|uniref:hypothetical protein n=1 Tax=Candidatus Nitrosocosmicus agrestis TaxID=2563600 RepID=UPI0012B563E0|nr:hypothetical protein [Candidatus Nitrosocosmicus sp. SS]MDR4492214.1 hypothetical protein [Candidatus Nitrosocosmicus sp.]HET6589098.1 hypothetical protein [Candidatus Nitrosocosmicus sp.]
MNKITKEIANILHNEIDNQTYDIQNSGLSTEQINEIKKFVSTYNRSGFGGFYPLKAR